MTAADIHCEKNMSTSGEIRKKDYDDEEIRGIEILSIYNYTHEDGPGVWDNIFRSLRDGITKEGMLQLISLACHIQDREGKLLMKEKSSNHRTQILTNGTHLIRDRTRFAGVQVQKSTGASQSQSPSKEDAERKPLLKEKSSNHRTQILTNETHFIRARTRFAGVQVQKSTGASQSWGDGEEDAKSKFKAVCYFAACLMRLVTKPPDNFMRSLARIKDQYFNFYCENSGYLNSLKFERPMVEHISLAFRVFPVFKHTIAHHVAVADLEHRRNLESFGILRFACIQHLEFHGMNVYSQFAHLINRMTWLSPALYLTWLRCPANNSALDMIRHINLNYDPPKEGRTPTRFWIYARIFDSGYFLQLEPNSCKYLLAIQAYLTIHYLYVKPEGYGSPLEIPAIKNDKELLSSAKLMAYEFVWAAEIFGVYQKMTSPIWKKVLGITDELADAYVRAYDISSVQLDDAGPLWRSFNDRLKADNQVGRDIKHPAEKMF